MNLNAFVYSLILWFRDILKNIWKYCCNKYYRLLDFFEIPMIESIHECTGMYKNKHNYAIQQLRKSDNAVYIKHLKNNHFLSWLTFFSRILLGISPQCLQENHTCFSGFLLGCPRWWRVYILLNDSRSSLHIVWIQEIYMYFMVQRSVEIFFTL